MLISANFGNRDVDFFQSKNPLTLLEAYHSEFSSLEGIW